MTPILVIAACVKTIYSGTSSPFDANFAEYWEESQTKESKSYWAKKSKYEQVVKQQTGNARIGDNPYS